MFAPSQTLSLLKEGSRHFSGLEEAVLRDIEAGKQLAAILKTSLGPNGRKKLIINQHDKLIVTSDAATIIKELEVVHPAAKLIVLASQQQEQEVGDGTNFVIIFAGELLLHAETLIRNGVHTSDIINGYQKAGKKAIEILEELSVYKLEDLRDYKKVAHVLRPVITTKQFGYDDVLAPLISQACIQVLPKDPATFNPDNVRVAKILGGGVLDTKLVKGFAVTRDAEGTIKHVSNAKVTVFVSGIDIAKPETKGTVLIKTAEQLLNYTKEEEKLMEEVIKSIAESGTNVIVVGAAVSDIAMHFIERYKMMCVRCPSKFNLRRVCKAIGATPLVRVGPPTAGEIGHCDLVTVEEIGSTKVTIFRQDDEDSAISTLIIRAATQNTLDDVERAVDDGVNAFKGFIRDPRFVPGAGATEMELSRRIQQFGESSPGLDQYGIKKFAEALEVVPRILADNAGLVITDIISSLTAAHAAGKSNAGVDIDEGNIRDITNDIVDSLNTKHWAIRFAVEVAVTVLSVDQIIMAKPAGGPKPRAPRAADADDDGPDQGPM